MPTATSPWAAEHAAHFARLLVGGDRRTERRRRARGLRARRAHRLPRPPRRHWRLDPDSTPERICVWIRSVTGGYLPRPARTRLPALPSTSLRPAAATSPSPPAGAAATRSSSTSRSRVRRRRRLRTSSPERVRPSLPHPCCRSRGGVSVSTRRLRARVHGGVMGVPSRSRRGCAAGRRGVLVRPPRCGQPGGRRPRSAQACGGGRVRPSAAGTGRRAGGPTGG